MDPITMLTGPFYFERDVLNSKKLMLADRSINSN